MPETIHQRIERERKAANPEADLIQTYRRYARGDHDKVLSADQMRLVAGLGKHRFADNACGKILALLASRLEFLGYSVPDDGVQVFLDGFFIKNQLADKQFDVHFATNRDGNHAGLLGWRPSPRAGDAGGGRVTFHRERWWDGKLGMWVAYGEDNEPEYAVKDFEVVAGDPLRTITRRTVYFPDHLERYVFEGGAWHPFDLEEEPAIADWTKRDGSPLGIPVVHFANGSNDDTPYGMSELDGGVLGLQDHLNDVHWDITVGARLLGFPILTATGYRAAKDANGKDIPIRVGPGTFLKSESADTSFGQIQPGDMSKLIDVYRMKKETLASNTGTPEHVISGGEWPSGLALMRAEMPLVAKIERQQKTIGPSWVQVGHRATEIANAFGPPGLNEEPLIEPRFADAERLDPTAQAEADKLQLDVWVAAAAIEDDVILRKTGLFTDAEIAAIRRQRAKRAEQAMAALVGASGSESEEEEEEAATPPGGA